jgi:hypothetical protein
MNNLILLTTVELLAALLPVPPLLAQPNNIPRHKIAGGGTLGAPTVTKIVAMDSARSLNVLKIRTGNYHKTRR